MNKFYYKSAISLALGALLGLFTLGCEEDELYTLSQEEEVERYLSDSYLGKAFFSKTYALDNLSFTFPEDDTLYSVIFNSNSRSYTLYDLGHTIQLPTGEYYDCRAQVVDIVSFTLRKSISGQVFDTTLTDRFERWGYLVKLGDNSQAYSGWLLQGIAALSEDVLNITTLDGAILSMDYVNPLMIDGVQIAPVLPAVFSGYMDINNVSTLNGASQIAVDTCGSCVKIAHYETGAGFVAQLMPDSWSVPPCYVDTFTVGASPEVVYTSLSIQTICRVNGSTISHNIRYIPFWVDR